MNKYSSFTSLNKFDRINTQNALIKPLKMLLGKFHPGMTWIVMSVQTFVVLKTAFVKEEKSIQNEKQQHLVSILCYL